MNREIKFRAWEFYNNTMHEPFKLTDIDSDGGYGDIYPAKVCKASLCVFEFDDPNLFKIMQYTGLKDKNGKEIYEGDILNDLAFVEWFENLSWDGGGSLHPGYYCRKWLDIDDEDERELNYSNGFRDVEVIGNIYENSHLIKAETDAS